MTVKKRTIGQRDATGRVIVPGVQVVTCNGYIPPPERFDKKYNIWIKHVTDCHDRRGRYNVEAFQITPGIVGIVLCRNRHLKSMWDVLIDGRTVSISAKYIQIINAI